MGFNSTILILNDRLHEIENDPEFGAKLAIGINEFGYASERQKSYITGQTKVLSCQHADNMAVIAVGGNCGTKLDTVFGLTHHKEDDKLEIVKQMAENLGYRLEKM